MISALDLCWKVKLRSSLGLPMAFSTFHRFGAGFVAVLTLSLSHPCLSQTVAQMGISRPPEFTEYPRDKVLSLSKNPEVNVHFIVEPLPIQEPPLPQWRLGLKVTDTEGKTLAEMPGGSPLWQRPFIQDVVIIHGTPVILLGNLSQVVALRYSSGYLSDVGDWMGARIEFQFLDDGDYEVVVSAAGPEDLPNAFRFNGEESGEDTQRRAALLKHIVGEASDEVEHSLDKLGSVYRWTNDCFRALRAAVTLNNRAEALRICARARERIQTSTPKLICVSGPPDCNERQLQLDLEQFDSDEKSRSVARISVLVTDLAGAQIPYAQIKLTPQETTSTNSETDERGEKSLEVLPGIYDLFVTARDLAPWAQTIRLEGNATQVVVVTLQPGTVSPIQ
jgi:hypothetical protein